MSQGDCFSLETVTQQDRNKHFEPQVKTKAKKKKISCYLS